MAKSWRIPHSVVHVYEALPVVLVIASSTSVFGESLVALIDLSRISGVQSDELVVMR